MKELSFRQAIGEAINEEMARDPRVFVLGEDVGHSPAVADDLHRRLWPLQSDPTPVHHGHRCRCCRSRLRHGIRDVLRALTGPRDENAIGRRFHRAKFRMFLQEETVGVERQDQGRRLRRWRSRGRGAAVAVQGLGSVGARLCAPPLGAAPPPAAAPPRPSPGSPRLSAPSARTRARRRPCSRS